MNLKKILSVIILTLLLFTNLQVKVTLADDGADETVTSEPTNSESTSNETVGGSDVGETTKDEETVIEEPKTGESNDASGEVVDESEKSNETVLDEGADDSADTVETPKEETKTDVEEDATTNEESGEVVKEDEEIAIDVLEDEVEVADEGLIETINITASQPKTSYIVSSRASIDATYKDLATLGKINKGTFKASSTIDLSDEKGGSGLYKRYYAQSATVYVASFALKPADGKHFSENSVITVNGNKADFVVNEDGTVSVTYKHKKTAEAIANANVNIVAPVAGGEFASSATVDFTDSQGNTHTLNSTSVTYYVDNTKVKTHTAGGNTAYTVQITFDNALDGDYVFTSSNCETISKVKVNNSETLANVTVNTKGYATFKYTFAKTESAVTEETCVAKNSTTEVMYETLDSALANANENDTVVLTKDTTESVTINKGVTLDLNGHTITAPENSQIININASGKSVTIKNGTLTGANSNYHGGAIAANESKEVIIDEVNFINNKTIGRRDGGAICAYASSGKLIIKNSKFLNNSSVQHGGAIDTHVDTEISDSYFEGNGASLNNPGATGGAIYYASNNSHGSSTTLKLNRVTMKNNTASAGGAIASGSSSYLYSSNVTGYTSTIVLTDTTITENSASMGGAIYLVGNGTRFVMESGTISSNKAATQGGAIYSSNWEGIKVNSGTISGNSANYGGAIYIEDVSYQNKFNLYSHVDLGESVTVTGNSAIVGGGVYVKDAVTGDLKGNIYNNNASSYASDIYANDAKFTISEAKAKGTLSCNHSIDGWYLDGNNSRWVGHGDKEKLNVSKLTDLSLSGEVALKAAHGLVTLKVNYLYEDGSVASKAYEDNKVEYGKEYSVDSPTIEGYLPFLGVKNDEGTIVAGTDDGSKVTGKISESSVELNVVYTANPVNPTPVNPDPVNPTPGTSTKFNLTVNYVDTSGNKVADSFNASYDAGYVYNISSPSVSGYTPDKTSVNGMLSNDTTLTVTYTGNPVTPTTDDTVTPVTPTPTPRRGTTVVTPSNNTTTPTTPVEEVTEEDNSETVVTPTTPTEQDNTETVVVEDNETPLALNKSWALINLIAACLTVLTSIILLLSKHSRDNDEDENEEEATYMEVNDEEDEEQEEETRRKKWKVINPIVSIISVIVFILTENMRNPMVLVDKWTLLMVAILLVNIVTLYLGRKWHKPDEEEEEEVQTA